MNNLIKKCFIGRKYADEIKELNDLGIETILLPENKLLDNEICNHADIQIFNCRNDKFIVDSSIIGELKPLFNDITLVSCSGVKSPYPKDIKLNAAILGNKIICNSKFISPEILTFAHNENYEIIHTNQGYTKCNLCVVTDNAVLTEDDGLSSLLKNYQIDVLKIKKGNVHLSKVHYGFIGGAGCKIADDTMYFSGDISKHPDYCIINDFLNKYGVLPIYNKNRKLTDFGGLIPIC